MTAEGGEPGRLRRAVTSPVLLVLVIAPFFGEGLSGSSPPAELLMPWNLAFMAALYGCGALVCRELAHRSRLGFAGLVLLGVAYAVWEEALVDRYWFFSQFWQDSGVGTYRARYRPWAGRSGLALACLVLALTPVVYGEFTQRPPTTVLAAAGILLAAVVMTAFLAGHRRRLVPPSLTGDQPRPRRSLGLLAFTCACAHWILTYTAPEMGLNWPSGWCFRCFPLPPASTRCRVLP